MSCWCNQYTMYNYDSLHAHKMCVCTDCLNKYDVTKIRDWCDNGKTAICPYCWDDAVMVAPEYVDSYTENDILNCHKSMHGLESITKTITFTNEETYSIHDTNIYNNN